MRSELDILEAGVTFARNDAGRIDAWGPPSAGLRDEVLERLDPVRRRLAGGPSATTERWGACDTCGLPMGVVCEPYHCCAPDRCGVEVEGVRGHKCVVCYARCPGTDLTPKAHVAYHGGSNKSGTCLVCQCATQKVLDMDRAARAAEGDAP